MLDAQQRARLTWRCRRGMLELDLLFEQFLQQQLECLNEQQLIELEWLLTFPDPDLYSWLMGYVVPEDKRILAVVEFVRASHHPL